MSTNNSKEKTEKLKYTGITWGGWSAAIYVVIVFLLAQFVAVQIVSIYPLLRHWSTSQTSDWITNTIIGEFWYVLLAEALSVALIIWFIKWRKGSVKAIGLKRPKPIEDGLYALSGLAIYLPLYIVAVVILNALVPQFNINQQQQIGFTGANGFWQLTMVFFSLVILPPIAEEIMFRGFLYSGLRKAMPLIWAAVLTSALFATPHLLESSGGGLLWIAGLDTFILSMVLCWLRQKTNRLYAGMGLHALKNFIAFASLFLFHMR